MLRTVHRFICGTHCQCLQGEPRFSLTYQNNGDGVTTYKADVTMMRCSEEVVGNSCRGSWTMQTCNHVHGAEAVCNSMTCWNYRGKWWGAEAEHPAHVVHTVESGS